jgi:three-Cys-motif partner protein
LSRRSTLRFDEIGYWSEVKLDIVKDYAGAYSTILAAQKQHRLFHVYIDAFAGAGLHISKRRGQLVPGSPLNALEVQPPFREYHSIDLNQSGTYFRGIEFIDGYVFDSLRRDAATGKQNIPSHVGAEPRQ